MSRSCWHCVESYTATPPAISIQRGSDYANVFDRYVLSYSILLVQCKFLASTSVVRRSLGNLLGCVLPLHSCGQIVVPKVIFNETKVFSLLVLATLISFFLLDRL